MLDSSSIVAEEMDKIEYSANLIFDLINYRANLFGENYPFVYKDKSIELKTALSEIQKLYLYLLISSKLEDFKDYKNSLTSDFEAIAFNTLSSFLPTHAEVYELGKNSSLELNKTIQKLKLLSQKIKIKLNERVIKKNVSARNVNEEGVDIIAWLPFDDSNPNKLVFLCQCTCGKNWLKKMNDMDSYHSFFEFYKIKPIDVMFISYSIMDDENEFFSDAKFKSSGILMFERRRIIEFFRKLNVFSQSASYRIVDDLLNYNADLV